MASNSIRNPSVLWLWLPAWLLVTACLPMPAIAQLNRNDVSPPALGKAWGFYLGQMMRLERIERTHPSLQNDVLLARMEFKAAFPSFEANARKTLLAWSWKETDLDKMLETWRTNLQPVLDREPIDLETSRRFVQQVRGRSKGADVPEDILQYLLATSFMDRPELELMRGWRREYTSRGHPKAKGLTVQLKLPMSYAHREGERPNIVAKWVSEGGHGMEHLMLMVFKNDQKPMTRKEIEDDISRGERGEIHKAMSESGRVLSLRAFSQERASGIIAELDATAERAGVGFSMRSRHYLLFLPGRDVVAACYVGARKEDGEQLESRFVRISEVCRLFANSLVLPQQYQGGN